MKYKGEVGLGFRRKHSGGSKARVIDENRIIFTRPFDGIRRIGNNSLIRFIVPVLRIGQRVAKGNVELVIAHIMQEHIDAAKVIRRNIDLLTEKSVTYVFRAEHLGKLQQQGAGAAGRVINLVDRCFADSGYSGKKLRNLLWRIVFPAAFTRIGSIHAHEEFIGITESVNSVVLIIAAEIHALNTLQQFDQLFIASGYCIAQFFAVDVHIVKQSLEIVFAFRTGGGFLYMLECLFQRFVQIVVLHGIPADVGKKFTRQNEKALGGDHFPTSCFRFLIGHICIVETAEPRIRHPLVEIGRQIFGNIPVEQHPQNILLEVPAINASTKVIGDVPYGAVKFRAFLLFSVVGHLQISPDSGECDFSENIKR